MNQTLMFTVAFIVLLILLVALGFLVRWAFRRWMPAGPERITERETASTIGYQGPGGLQRAVMNTAETASVFLLIAITLLSAIAGAGYGRIFAFGSGQQDTQNYVVVFGLMGGLAGFFTASLLTAFFFTLAAIEKNTRHTAMMFEKLANRR